MDLDVTPPSTPNVEPQRFSSTLRGRILAVTAGSAALVAILLAASFFFETRGVMRDELQLRGRTVGIDLANNLAYAVFSGDQVGLEAAARSALRDIPDLAYVIVRNARGDILVEAAVPALGTELGPMLPVSAIEEGSRYAAASPTLRGELFEGVTAPVFFEEKTGGGTDLLDPLALAEVRPTKKPGANVAAAKSTRVGWVQVGLSTAAMRSKISTILLRWIALAVLLLLGCLTGAVFVARRLTVPLERLSLAAAGIAAGDLKQGIAEAEGKDEIAALAQSFAKMSQGLRSMLVNLQGASAEVQREAGTMLSTASRQAALTSEQASSINETGATAAEIAATSQQATGFADSVIRVTEKSEKFSREGQKIVEDSVAGIEKLGEQVRAIAATITELSERTLQIGDIISTVKDVAEKSNLLALNASIEAAKAGEQGRGFAVVAMEMKNLAEQSKLATGQVRAILGEVQKGTRAAVVATEEGSKRAEAAISLAQSAGNAIMGLAEAIQDSSQAAKQIATNTRQQTTGVEQIVEAISEQSRTMNEAVEGTRQIEAVAANLSRLSNQLSQLVARYRV